MGDFLRIKLIDAAKTNDMGELEFCLNIGDIDVNAVNESGVTALLAASAQGNIGVVERLLKHSKLDVNVKGKDKKSAFFIACQKGNTALATLLMKHPSVDVNTQDKLSNTALMAALRARHDEIVGLLLRHPNLDINQQKNDGTTALMLATNLGHLKVVQELLKRVDIDISLADKKGNTARDLAKKKNNRPIVAAFTDFTKRKESRASLVRGRVLSGNSKFREYQNTFNRGSSFLSSFDENDTKSSKKSGDVLSQMIRMKSADPIVAEADNLRNRIAAGRKPKPTATENIRSKRESTVSDGKSDAAQEKVTPEPAPDLEEAAKIKEQDDVQEESHTNQIESEPVPVEMATPVGQLLKSKKLEKFAVVLYKNHIHNLFLATKLTDFDLLHNLNIEGKGDRDALLEAFSDLGEAAAAPQRAVDLLYIADSDVAVLSSEALRDLKVERLAKIDLEEIFKSVEDTNCLACVFSDESFFKEDAVIAAVAWAFVHKIKIVGLNTGSSSASLMFKSLLRQGQGLLSEALTEQLAAFNIEYPNVYDAIESLSKNTSTNEDDFVEKVKK